MIRPNTFFINRCDLLMEMTGRADERAGHERLAHRIPVDHIRANRPAE